MSLIQQSVMNEDDELLNLISISRQHLFSKGSINNLKKKWDEIEIIMQTRGRKLKNENHSSHEQI